MSIITDEMVEVTALELCDAGPFDMTPFQARAYARAALAAVAPLIAQAEREACAKVAETHDWFVGGIGTIAPGSGQSRAIAAAIRARSTEEGQ